MGLGAGDRDGLGCCCAEEGAEGQDAPTAAAFKRGADFLAAGLLPPCPGLPRNDGGGTIKAGGLLGAAGPSEGAAVKGALGGGALVSLAGGDGGAGGRGRTHSLVLAASLLGEFGSH